MLARTRQIAFFGLGVILYWNTAFCLKDEDVLSGCDKTKLCIRDPPDCTSIKDCNIAAVFSKMATPGHLSVKLRVRNPPPNPYVLLHFKEAVTHGRRSDIYCSPGTDPLQFAFVPSERSGTLFADQKTKNRLGNVQEASVTDGILRCDFTRTYSDSETTQEKNAMLDKQIITLAAGSRKSDGGYGKPTFEVRSEDPIRFLDALEKTKPENVVKEDSGPPLQLENRNENATLRNEGTSQQEVSDASDEDANRDGKQDSKEKDELSGKTANSGSHLIVSGFVTAYLLAFLASFL